MNLFFMTFRWRLLRRILGCQKSTCRLSVVLSSSSEYFVSKPFASQTEARHEATANEEVFHETFASEYCFHKPCHDKQMICVYSFNGGKLQLSVTRSYSLIPRQFAVYCASYAFFSSIALSPCSL